MKIINVPTGHICIAQGDKGQLEFLSIGDYGKEKNIKADFLGMPDKIQGVPNGEIMPLEEKWVITISSQYGCSMGCTFCDVPKVGPGKNVTLNDLTKQVTQALALHPEVKTTKRLNLHYARMGEPTFNPAVLTHAAFVYFETKPYIGLSPIHPVVSTMLPWKNKNLFKFLDDWCRIKNGLYQGSAGLQFSINSTDDLQRHEMFAGNSLTLDEIAAIGSRLPKPVGRKYALNFALADSYEVDARRLRSLFSPRKFMVKITPLHRTKACQDNQIQTTGGYDYYTPYEQIEANLKAVGFDVLVFIPSKEEDESRITCGNALLADEKGSLNPDG